MERKKIPLLIHLMSSVQ